MNEVLLYLTELDDVSALLESHDGVMLEVCFGDLGEPGPTHASQDALQ